MSQLTEAEKHDQMELNMSLQRLHIPNVTFRSIVRRTPGKGRGVFATMAIPRGAFLMAEEVLFSVDDVQEPLSRYNKVTIKRGASEFPQFQDLVCTANPPSDESRFETNNFEMGIDRNGGKTYGIFFQASRFNHSCIPNAYFAWNPELDNGQGRLTIYAIQDIHASEEILINYRTKDCYKLKDARQAELNNHYGFVCDCPACRRQPGQQFGAKSDERRRRMQTLQAKIDRNWDLDTPSGREAKREIINKLIENLKQEGFIYPQLADALDELGKLAKELSVARAPNAMCAAAYATDCRNSALQIAREKLDLDVRCTGFNSPVFMEALKFIRDLDH